MLFEESDIFKGGAAAGKARGGLDEISAAVGDALA